jgi:putative zinc-binding metallo-peptidase
VSSAPRPAPAERAAASPPAGPRAQPPPPSGRARRPLPPSVWEGWDDEKLLDLRLCDLGLSIDGSGLEDRLAELFRELEARGLRFRPHYWLSDEWFCPDGVPGMAIPFYLAHPRLARLEQSQMLEVEGGTREWCLKILRHETGHAIENAYRLRRRRRRQQLFGRTTNPYPEYYAPRPYSKSFVLHLDAWYAQSHPDEDFAETFAVWLSPESEWRTRYGGWPALRKLEYMDDLMKDLAGQAPLVISRRKPELLSRLRRTLREHYRIKRRHYGLDHPDFYDRDLKRLFSDALEHAGNPTAAGFLNRIRREVRRRVGRWTGAYQYTIDQVLADIVARSRELNLRLAGPEDETKLEFITLLTVQTMNYLASGRHRVAL